MQLTKELVESSLITEVTKRNFQHLMEAAKNAIITEKTIVADYEIFKSLIEIFTYLEGRLKIDNKPEKEVIDTRKSAYDQYLKPLKELFDKFEPEFIRINSVLKQNDKQKLDAIKKVNEILSRYKEFVKSTINAIIGAETSNDLATIQMLIGTEKSKKKFYGEYSDTTDKTYDILLELIDGRKDLLKERAKLQKEMSKWEAKGDVPRVIQIKEQIDLNEATYAENINAIAERAFEEIKPVALLSENIEETAIEARTHRWAWRIDDPELLYKKMPDLVTIEGNAKAINLFMNTKKEELNRDEEHNFSGLVMYYKPFYIQPPKTV